MLKPSPDAAHILALPHANHPRLRPLCEQLAALSKVTLADAVPILDAAAACVGVSSLDLDMIQPGAQVAIPFAATSNEPGGEHQDRVSHLVQQQLAVIQGGRR